MAKPKKPPKPKKPKTYIDYGQKKVSCVIGKKPDGSPNRKYFYGSTKNEAKEKMYEYKRQHAIGLDIGEMTVNDWAMKWLEVRKANATDTQKAHYKAKMEHDILPTIGSMRIRDVRSTDLQKLLNAYAGGKKGTVEKIRIALCQLFDDAEIEGLIIRNPAVRLDLPAVEEEPRRPLNDIERKIVIQVAESHPRGAYVQIMLYCGLRRGECIALLCSDIDLENKRMSVTKAITFSNGNTGDLTDTKAAKMRKKVKRGEDVGSRVVPIPDVLLPVLTALCVNKTPEEALFPKVDGKQATQSAVNGWWKSFKRHCHIAAGAKLYRNAIIIESSPFGDELTPHFLRHTYATDLYAAGLDEKARKIFLGHSSNDVTDIYTQMSVEAFDRALELLNKYYSTKDGVNNEVNKNNDEE